MKKRLLLCLLVVLLSCITAAAQQSQSQPLTFWYEYVINPGKEDDFLDLVKTVGQPVRDKLMADGVVLGWGMEVPLLRQPGGATHVIWYAVSDWSGVDKVDSAMRVQIAKFSGGDESKAPAAKKAQKLASVMDRLREDADMGKTRDYLTRDLVTYETSSFPAGIMPYTRYNYVKVRPGRGGDYRKAWEKYNKPVFDKLVADGTLLGYGLSVEEVRTDGDFTHFVWMETKDLSSMEKVRSAFAADREHRSEEERNALNDLFLSLVDADASRSEVTRTIVFHVPGAK